MIVLLVIAAKFSGIVRVFVRMPWLMVLGLIPGIWALGMLVAYPMGLVALAKVVTHAIRQEPIPPVDVVKASLTLTGGLWPVVGFIVLMLRRRERPAS
jgi:hypothetical protein